MRRLQIWNSALLIGLLMAGCGPSGSNSTSAGADADPSSQAKAVEVPEGLQQYAALCSNVEVADLNKKSFKQPKEPAIAAAAVYEKPFGPAVVVKRVEVNTLENRVSGDKKGKSEAIGSFETMDQWKPGTFQVTEANQIQSVACLIEDQQGSVLRLCRYERSDGGSGTGSFSDHTTTLHVALIEAKTGKGIRAKKFEDERDEGKKEKYKNSANKGCPASYRFKPEDNGRVALDGKALTDKQTKSYLGSVVEVANKK